MLEGGKKKMMFMFYSHCLQNLSNNDSNDSRLKEMSRSGFSCGHYFPFFVLRCPRFTS